MATKQITVVLNMDTAGLSRGAVRAKAEMLALSSVASKSGKGVDLVSVSVNKMNKATADTVMSLQDLRRGIVTARVISLAFAGSLGVVATKIVQIGAEAQRTKALLEGLSTAKTEAGRQAQAATEFRFLRDFAKTAPMGMKAITDSFVKLKTAGIDPMDGSLKAMVAGISKVGGSDEQLKRATVAIQQMAGKGTISLEELRQQLGEAMPQAMRLMAEAAGMEMPAFVDKVSKGQVRFTKALRDNFFKLVQADAGDAQKRMMETLQGQSNLAKTELTNIAQLIAGVKDGRVVAGGLIDELTKGMKQFVGYLQSPEGQKAAADLGKNFGSMAASLREISALVVQNIGPLTKIAAAVAALYVVQGTKNMLGQAGQRAGEMRAQIASVNAQINSQGTLAKAEAATASQRAASWTAYQANKRAELTLTQENIVALQAQRAAQLATIETARAATIQNGYLSRNLKENAADLSALRAAEAGLITTERSLAAAQAQRAAIQARLSTVDQQVQRSAAASSAALQNLQVATRTSTVAFNGLRAAGGMLTSALGGGVGIAIMAVAAGLAYMSARSRDAELAMRDVGKETRNLAAAAIQTREGQGDFSESLKFSSDKALVAADSSYRYATALDQVRRTARLAGEEIAYMTTQQRVQMREETQKRLRDARRGLDGGMFDDGLNGKIARAEAEVAGIYSNGRVMPGMPQTTQIAKTAMQGREFANGRTRGAMDHLQELYDLRDETKRGILEEEAVLKEIAALTGKGQKVRPDPKGTNTPEPAATPKPDKASERANNRLQDDTRKLMATRQALVAVSQGAGASAEAIALVTAKIESMEDRGAKLSKEQVANLYAAAKGSVEVGKGLKAYNDIIQGAEESTEGLAATIADLSSNNGEASGSTNALAREQTIMLSRIRDGGKDLDGFSMKLAQQAAAANVANRALSDYALTILNIKQANQEAEQGLDDVGPDYWRTYAKSVNDANRALLEAEKRVKEVEAEGDPEATAKAIEDLNKLKSDQTQATSDALDVMSRQSAKDTADRLAAIEEIGMSEEQVARRRHARESAALDLLREQVAVMNSAPTATEGDIARRNKMVADNQAVIDAQLKVDLKTPGDRLVEQWSDVTSRMKDLQADWMGDFFDRLASGNMKWGEFTKKILQDWLAMQLRAKLGGLVDSGLDALMSFAGGVMGGGPSASIGSGIAAPAVNQPDYGTVGLYHSGRGPYGAATARRLVDPAMFAGAPRYHNGRVPGLKSWEEAAIIRRDESVLTPEQMSAIGGRGGAPKMEINLINESGNAIQGEEQGTRFDGERYITDIVISGMNKRGRLRDTMSNLK